MHLYSHINNLMGPRLQAIIQGKIFKFKEKEILTMVYKKGLAQKFKQ